MASRDSFNFFGHPLLILCNEVDGLQDGATVPRIGVYFATLKTLPILQEIFDMLPEKLMGKL